VKIGDLVRVCPRHDSAAFWTQHVQPPLRNRSGPIGVIVGPLVAGRYWQVFVDEQFLLLFQDRLEVIS
jgi:hypothetical protein